MPGAPDLIAIEHDDYHARHIGITADGKQFFLTRPFDPAFPGLTDGCEYVALYLFDEDGQLLEALIDSFGPRDKMDEAKARTLYDQRLHDLGDVDFGRIEVAPFAVQRFGTTFGLVTREPEDEDDAWAVEMQPGNHMAFFEPWDSGEYDT